MSMQLPTPGTAQCLIYVTREFARMAIVVAALMIAAVTPTTAEDGLRSDLKRQVDDYARLFGIERRQLPDVAIVALHEGDCFPAENLRLFHSLYGAEVMYSGSREIGEPFWVMRRSDQVDILARSGEQICFAMLGRDGHFSVLQFDEEYFLMIAFFIGMGILYLGFKIGSYGARDDDRRV